MIEPRRMSTIVKIVELTDLVMAAFLQGGTGFSAKERQPNAVTQP